MAAYAAYELAVAAHRPNGTPALSPGRLFILIVLSVAALLYRLSQNHAAAAGGGGSNFAAYRAGQAQLDPSQTGSPPDHIRYEHERLDVRAMEERSSDFLRSAPAPAPAPAAVLPCCRRAVPLMLQPFAQRNCCAIC